MKKLIAILLCIAMVAALGVQAFAAELTNQEKADKAAREQAKQEKAQQNYTDAADMEKAWEKLYYDYDVDVAALEDTLGASSDAFKAAKAELDVAYQIRLNDIKATNKTAAGWMETTAPTAWTLQKDDPHNAARASWWTDNGHVAYCEATADTYDAAIAAAKADAIYFGKLAEIDAANAAAAEAAAKLEAAATKAAEAAVKNPKTSAEWLAYWAAYDKVYADNNLSTAKKAAETAKASVATAQKAAIASAKVAITEAQAVAYNNMQAEIVKAVDEYVAGVNTALAEFYAGLAG